MRGYWRILLFLFTLPLTGFADSARFSLYFEQTLDSSLYTGEANKADEKYVFGSGSGLIVGAQYSASLFNRFYYSVGAGYLLERKYKEYIDVAGNKSEYSSPLALTGLSLNADIIFMVKRDVYVTTGLNYLLSYPTSSSHNGAEVKFAFASPLNLGFQTGLGIRFNSTTSFELLWKVMNAVIETSSPTQNNSSNVYSSNITIAIRYVL